METCVDFAYAFATPHRLTVARPDSNDKTLLDCQPGSLRMAWSYDNPGRFPTFAFMTPTTTWELWLTPQVEGQSFVHSAWTRLDGYLPILDNTHYDGRGVMRIEAAGAATACVLRITMKNTGDRARAFSLRVEKPGAWAGYNPAWVDSEAAGDTLLAGWLDRADRVLALGMGADHHPVTHANALTMLWRLAPGETRTAWLARPYSAYSADLPALRRNNWQAEFEHARAEWQALCNRAARVHIPDPGVRNAFYAGLADLFIMREPIAGGHIVGEPGTEMYRAPNSYEAGILAIALDQAGLHEEAEAGYRLPLALQEPDGNWTEPQGWGHLMWGASGFKCWTAMTHYQLTGNRDFLAQVYPRMAASSRWQETQRARTRRLVNGERPLTYGLMPRGMGDCGLKDDDDLYGVFIPHNIWAVYADRCSVEAARILGHTSDLPELERIHETALSDLMRAMDDGAIRENGYRWIPGVPGKTSGSRWGVLNALFPCALLPPDHELITGTLRKIESQLSPGGIPINTGWLPDGMWVAITLDNVAEAHLARGNGDAAAEYVLATLNHGTPLYSWCEERGQDAGSSKITGDRQHLWTPVAVVRTLRDCLVMERDNGLELALGIPRLWLDSGEPVGIDHAPTRLGLVSYQMRYESAQRRVRGTVHFPDRAPLDWVRLHVRLPRNLRLAGMTQPCGATIVNAGAALHWATPHGEVQFEAAVE